MSLPRRWRRGASAQLCGGALLAYGAALSGALVYDDIHSVAANPALSELGNLPRFFVDPGLFSGNGDRMYRPVLLATLALNHAVGGGAVVVLKLGNLLAHVLTVLALWSWLRSVGLRARAATGGALLFAVHPLVSEAVNLVSGRSEQLLVLGLLLALRSHRAWQRGNGFAWLGVLGGGLLACGSKETGIVLPGLLACQELWWRSRARSNWRAGAAVLRLCPAAGLALGYLLVRRLLLGTATVQLLGRANSEPLVGGGRDLVAQLATMGTALPRALLQAPFPFGLSLEPKIVLRDSLGDPWALLGWGSVLLLTSVALAQWRRRPAVALGALFAWATSLPWIVIPLNLPLAEHRLYGMVAGLAVVAAAGWPSRTAPAWRRLLPVAFVVMAVPLAALRSLDYRDERSLWRGAMAANPLHFRVHWGLGTAEYRHGRMPEAVAALATAWSLYPDHTTVQRNLVQALLQLPAARQQPFRALVHAQRYDAMMEADPFARILRAEAELQVGSSTGDPAWFAQAEQTALSCLLVGPPKGLVYRTAAMARRRLGDDAGALAHLDDSIRRGLDHWTVRLDRVEVLRALGRDREARQELMLCQQQAPGVPAVLAALRQSAPGPGAAPR